MAMSVDSKHQFLAWGLLVVVVLVAAVFVVLPLHDVHEDYDRQIDRAYERLARLQGLADLVPETREKIQEVLEQDASAFFIQAANVEEASLGLRKLIDELAGQHAIQIASVDNLKTSGEGQVKHVGVSVRASAPPEALVAMFDDLERHRPLVSVDNLVLSVGRRPRSRAMAQTDQPPQQDLTVSFELQGYFVGEGR